MFRSLKNIILFLLLLSAVFVGIWKYLSQASRKNGFEVFSIENWNDSVEVRIVVYILLSYIVYELAKGVVSWLSRKKDAEDSMSE
jgi:Zn-dependent protease with chaperone function